MQPVPVNLISNLSDRLTDPQTRWTNWINQIQSVPRKSLIYREIRIFNEIDFYKNDKERKLINSRSFWPICAVLVWFFYFQPNVFLKFMHIRF